jgi:hypothetical protein
MIKNRDRLQEFEAEIIQKEKVDILKNFRLVDAMYEEALSLGAFSKENVLDGLDKDIKLAKAINSVSKTT